MTTGGKIQRGLVALLVLVGMVLAREAIVSVFGIQQEMVLRISGNSLFCLAGMPLAAHGIAAVIGSAIVLLIGWMLSDGKDQESCRSARNMRWGTAAGFMFMCVVNVELFMTTWVWAVAGVALLCGCLMGAKVIGRSGLYGGFGIVYGAALFYSVRYGFEVAGALLVVAVVTGIILWFLGFIIGRIRVVS